MIELSKDTYPELRLNKTDALNETDNLNVTLYW